MELNEVKKFLGGISQEKIIFDSHFYKRILDRPINEGMIRSFLMQLDKLEKIEIGKKENRFKLWFKMSRKYFLVVIIEIYISKGLKVISAWNSNRKWQNKLKQ
ncbi:MAG TPA: hypothetical protein PLE51_03785 [Candidatus Pacearchaeota archaeon]|nr:hypothetical protein [Candidatus Pacearchaeota archaeon]HOU79582.1 hypothetical protein [Candidatus Pacearchaeota archaeon]HQF83282.1 hypothetical protein [Candidatus Pacearchaeota archaeon]HQJ58166.1 hypothetical protein [Candidatus Pacearchaeota archaeon]